MQDIYPRFSTGLALIPNIPDQPPDFMDGEYLP